MVFIEIFLRKNALALKLVCHVNIYQYMNLAFYLTWRG